MDLLAAAGLYPLVVVVLACGAGLLVDRAAGRTLPGPLVPVAGLALLVVLPQLASLQDATAELGGPALVVAALAGFALGLPRLRGLRGAPDLLPVAAGVAAAYAVGIAPVVLSGDVTLPGYLKDTTTGTHLMGADWLVHQGRAFTEAPLTSSGLQLRGYFDLNAYPSGGHTLLGATGGLLGLELLWAFAPLMALAAALSACGLYVVARTAGAGRWWAAAAAAVAAVPATTYGYTLMGSIKEVVFAPLLAGLLGLAVAHRDWLGRAPAAAVPFALVAAAGLTAVGVPAGAWIGVAAGVLVLVALVALREHRLAPRTLGVTIGLAVVAGLVAALPVLGDLGTSYDAASAFNAANPTAASDPGNLVRPLSALQVLGAWFGGDHRYVPEGEALTRTYVLIGVLLVAGVLGVAWLVRRAAVVHLLLLAGLLVVWWALTRRGTIWTDAKLIVLTSPLVVLVAMLGGRRLADGGQRLLGVGLAAVVALAVLASDAEQYRATNLLPADRYREQLDVGERYAGKGPALITDFDEFAFYGLRQVGVDGAGFALNPPELPSIGYGGSTTTDRLPLDAVTSHRLLVTRRAPSADRPPAPFVRTFAGDFYDVWERREGVRVLEHVPAGGAGSPVGTPDCDAVRDAARRAGVGRGRLVVAERPQVLTRAAGLSTTSPGWRRTGDLVTLNGPGRLRTTFLVREPGRYRLWLQGAIARPVTVQLDGRTVGERGFTSGPPGNVAEPLEVTIDRAGTHVLELERGGGSLHPGDKQPTNLERITLEPAGATTRLREVPRGRWRALCDREVDWVAAVEGDLPGVPRAAGPQGATARRATSAG